MTIIELPDELAERLRVVAEAQDSGDLNRYVVAALTEIVDRAERLLLRRSIIEGCEDMAQEYLEMERAFHAADEELHRAFEY